MLVADGNGLFGNNSSQGALFVDIVFSNKSNDFGTVHLCRELRHKNLLNGLFCNKCNIN